MKKILLAVLLLLVVPKAFSASWTVCVEDRNSLLPVPVRGAMTKEFVRLVGHLVDGPRFGECREQWRTVAMTIQEEPPMGLEGVLGLAYREDNRIQPQLILFHGSLYRHAGRPNAGEALGRSLARVAAHEVLHFVGQRHQHCDRGLLMSSFSAYDLTAPDLWSLGYQRTCRTHDGQGAPSLLGRNKAKTGSTSGPG